MKLVNSSKVSLVLFVFVFVSFTGISWATTGSFQGLGDLAGGDFYSEARGISADGSTVVGCSASASAEDEAFRWTASTGMQGLGFMRGYKSRAWAVSGDGSAVVGEDLFSGGREAFRWTEWGGMEGLGYLSNEEWSTARGISWDGSVVAGESSSVLGPWEAFRWTQSSGMQGLGDLAGGEFMSSASAVSGNGLVVAGVSSSVPGYEAFRWTKSGGIAGLGRLPGKEWSIARGISLDGSVVVGCSGSDISEPVEAFRWTEWGGMTGLGDLPGGYFGSIGIAVSADGSVVVGFGHSTSDTEAIIWDPRNGMRSVRDVLENECGLDLTGWRLYQATGVSADGLTIAGWGYNPDGCTEAWIATIPDPLKGTTYYVDGDANGANDGSNWEDAFNYLQDALAIAIYGDQIWVAEGVYKPDCDSANPNGTGDREATFQLKNGVAVKGGYAGFGEPDPNARDVEVYEAILSGDLNGNDGEISDLADLLTDPNRAENSYHVVTGSGRGPAAVLDGFTITGGNANGPGKENHGDGGGMYNDSGSPTLTNCTFSGNSAKCSAGMYNRKSSPTLTNCTFANNRAELGGGMYNLVNSNPTLTNCTFSGNSAAWLDGGGMLNLWYSNPMLTNCTFSGNWAKGSGGGMYNVGYSNPMLSNCTFSGNWAKGSGGGMWNHESNPTVTNCTFSGNSAAYGGGIGGMYNYNDNSPTVTNCIFSGNSADEHGGGMASRWSDANLVNCTFSGNSADEYGGGMSSEGSDASLVNCTFNGNSAPQGSVLSCDSYEQRYPSNLRVTNCILWDGGDEIWNNDGSTITISYSNVQGGWPGEGNIDADPYFVASGYWVDANDPNIVVEPNDPNAVWVEGDYHLLAGSPCIDAGDNDSVPADIHDLDSDGNTTEPIPFDLDGNPRIVDGNDDGNSVVDMGAYEFFVPPIEVAMKFTPQALNPGSKGNWVKAHFVLPEGFTVEDVDTNSPAKIIEPFYVESDHMNVFINEDDLVEIEAAFDRGEFCGNGPVEGTIKVIGVLTTGQYFCGTDTIKIINNSLDYLAGLASHWLRAGCGAPDWCGGLDLDQDSAVNFVDFAMLDGCCIEFAGQ